MTPNTEQRRDAYQAICGWLESLDLLLAVVSDPSRTWEWYAQKHAHVLRDLDEVLVVWSGVAVLWGLIGAPAPCDHTEDTRTWFDEASRMQFHVCRPCRIRRKYITGWGWGDWEPLPPRPGSTE